MGEMALSLSKDSFEARRLFSAYLEIANNGDLREEALGHLMKINLSLGDRESAKRVAVQYLRQYKGGIYSERASAVVAD